MATTEECQLIIKGLAASTKYQMNIIELQKTYMEFEGCEVPYRKFGFNNLEAYLRSIPNTIRICGSGPYATIFPVVSEQSRNIVELIQKNKSSVKKPWLRQRGFNRHIIMPTSAVRPTFPGPPPNFMHVPPPNLRPGPPPNLMNVAIPVSVIESHFKNQSFYARPPMPQLNFQKRDPVREYRLQNTSEDIPSTSQRVVGQNKFENNKQFQSKEQIQSKEQFKSKEQPVPDPKIEVTKEVNATANVCVSSKGEAHVNYRVPHVVQENLKLLIREHPTGILDQDFLEQYEKTYGSCLRYWKFGFASFLEMCTTLHYIFKTEQVNDDEFKLYDAENSPTLVTDDKNINYKIPKVTQEELRELIRRHPDGLWCRNLLEEFEKLFKAPLPYRKFGYVSIVDMCLSLEYIFHTVQIDKGDFMLYDASKPVPNIASLTESKAPEIVDKEENVERVKSPMRNSDISLAFNLKSPDCVLKLGEKIEQLQINEPYPEYMEVLIGEVYDPSKFWFTLNEGEERLMNLINEMHHFYTINYENYKIPFEKCQVGLFCVYIYKYLEQFVRGVIVKVDPSFVKIFSIDFGTVSTVKDDTIFYLHRDFAEMPRQALRGRQAFIKPPFLNEQWSRNAATRFLKLVYELKLIASWVNIEKMESGNHIYEVALVDTRFKNDIWFHQALIAEGYAIATSQEAEELLIEDESFRVPNVDNIHLYPTFHELEHALVPNAANTIVMIQAGFELWDLYPQYYRYPNAEETERAKLLLKEKKKKDGSMINDELCPEDNEVYNIPLDTNITKAKPDIRRMLSSSSCSETGTFYDLNSNVSSAERIESEQEELESLAPDPFETEKLVEQLVEQVERSSLSSPHIAQVENVASPPKDLFNQSNNNSSERSPKISSPEHIEQVERSPLSSPRYAEVENVSSPPKDLFNQSMIGSNSEKISSPFEQTYEKITNPPPGFSVRPSVPQHTAAANPHNSVTIFNTYLHPPPLPPTTWHNKPGLLPTPWDFNQFFNPNVLIPPPNLNNTSYRHHPNPMSYSQQYNPYYNLQPNPPPMPFNNQGYQGGYNHGYNSNGYNSNGYNSNGYSSTDHCYNGNGNFYNRNDHTCNVDCNNPNRSDFYNRNANDYSRNYNNANNGNNYRHQYDNNYQFDNNNQCGNNQNGCNNHDNNWHNRSSYSTDSFEQRRQNGAQDISNKSSDDNNAGILNASQRKNSRSVDPETLMSAGRANEIQQLFQSNLNLSNRNTKTKSGSAQQVPLNPNPDTIKSEPKIRHEPTQTQEILPQSISVEESLSNYPEWSDYFENETDRSVESLKTSNNTTSLTITNTTDNQREYQTLNDEEKTKQDEKTKQEVDQHSTLDHNQLSDIEATFDAAQIEPCTDIPNRWIHQIVIANRNLHLIVNYFRTPQILLWEIQKAFGGESLDLRELRMLAVRSGIELTELSLNKLSDDFKVELSKFDLIFSSQECLEVASFEDLEDLIQILTDDLDYQIPNFNDLLNLYMTKI